MNLHDIPKEVEGPRLFWPQIPHTRYGLEFCTRTRDTAHHVCANLAFTGEGQHSDSSYCECWDCRREIHYFEWSRDMYICTYCTNGNHPNRGEHSI